MTSKPPLGRKAEHQKLIAFPLANHRVALPLQSVLRVLHHQLEDNDDSLNAMGLLQIGHYVIRAINLYQWLTPGPSPQPPFLIIVRGPTGEPVGVWADDLPDLVELSPDSLRSLPPSAIAASRFLGLMSHAAVISDGGENRTVFLLNISQALNTHPPDGAALPSRV
ncbi:MAG: chemotaxis protein CheW [Elainellaceae cyanobacterium]